MTSRRDILTAGLAGLAGGTLSVSGLRESLAAAPPVKIPPVHPPGKVFRIGAVSARIQGKPQPTNGHTWHFLAHLHPRIDLNFTTKYLDPGSARIFREFFRNPKTNFGQSPLSDTVISHYYEADPAIAKRFTEAYVGTQVARSVEEMVKEIDALWLGDASGFGEDHFDLIAPALEKGLPVFCDKPIGASVAGTRKILEFARKHHAPIMSSSLFRHQWGTEEALRMRDSKEFGDLQYVIASQAGGYSPSSWLIYGQHPTWMAVTLCGAGIDAVNLYARENASHALITYKDRMPAEVWCGRPDASGTYCSTAVHFQKKVFEYTPAIEGNYWLGHHYQIFNMARTFRDMVRTRVEPVPHQEILEVTAVIHAGVKSLQEKSRLVSLSEVIHG